MTRLLAAAALGLGLLATNTPANACEFSQCAWGKIVCAEVGCPIVCTPAVTYKCWPR
jgi:hypothetical protein